jgi:hypothetical protein
MDALAHHHAGHEFWVSSGHLLLQRDAAGHLAITDEFLKAFYARPEAVPPPEACAAERALHARLMIAPADPVDAAEIAAMQDPDARENWQMLIAFRDLLLSSGTLEAAYLRLVRDGMGRTPPIFVNQLVHAILRNAMDEEESAFVLRAAEMFFRAQRHRTGVEIQHQEDPSRLPRLQGQLQPDVLLAHVLKGITQAQHRQPIFPIQATVDEFQGAVNAATGRTAPLRSGVPPYLEDVAEVRIEPQGQRHRDGPVPIAGEAELLQAGGGGQDGAALQVDRHRGGAAVTAIVVAEMAHEHPHSPTLCGAQHQGWSSPQQQLQPADVAGAAMEDADIGLAVRADLATGIQDREGFLVLEDEGMQRIRHAPVCGGRG